MYIINEQKEEMNMLYTVSGRTPSGTFTSWDNVAEVDLPWFKEYLGDTYHAEEK